MSSWWLLPKLPVPHGASPVLYKELRNWKFTLLVSLVSLISTALVAWKLPTTPWLWIGLESFAVVAICVDAQTRYLPKYLCWGSWILGGVGIVSAIPLWGVTVMWRAILGALICGCLGWLAWRFLQFGFGDVRLLLLIGASSAAVSWNCTLLALMCGTTVGAGWALVVARKHGLQQTFAYGPALWAGPFIALLVL